MATSVFDDKEKKPTPQRLARATQGLPACAFQPFPAPQGQKLRDCSIPRILRRFSYLFVFLHIMH